jgi:CBS domain containing-hemolysin-like protein
MTVSEIPWLVAMGILLLASAFFSSCEAAWFYLGHKDRKRLAGGTRSQQLGVSLLDEPDRLLSAVLFWNLLVNLAYFTISSILALRFEETANYTGAAIITVGSLMMIIVFSEMLPKNLAVLVPTTLVSLFAFPLAAMVKSLDRFQPIFTKISQISLRLIWPSFTSEKDLRVDDLERALDLSVEDAALVDHERDVLRAIVLLSDIRAEELMQPRTGCRVFCPPVAWRDLRETVPGGGYLLVSEPESEEIASAVNLNLLSVVPEEHLEHHAEPVLYVPWSITVAAVLGQMRQRERRVAVVINEFGETIGVLTFEAILDQIFLRTADIGESSGWRRSIESIGPGLWRVTGITTLRELGREVERKLPESKGVTVAGIVQEVLERLPEVGDSCRWGPLQFEVKSLSCKSQMEAEVSLVEPQEEQP